MGHERTERSTTPNTDWAKVAEVYMEAGKLLGQELVRSSKSPNETQVMPRSDGSLIFSGRHATLATKGDQVLSFHDRRSGLTYQPAEGNADSTSGFRTWNVTDRTGTQVGVWQGKIEADKTTGEIKKTGNDSTTTYKANGARETKYPGGGSEIETPDGRKTVTLNGHTFVIEPRPATRPGQPGPDGRMPPPGPRPGPGPDGRMLPPGPQPGDRPQVPPPQGRTGDQPWPPQARPTGGDSPQPRPTPERPAQPRADQPLMDQLQNLFRMLIAKLQELNAQGLAGDPPVAPKGLNNPRGRRLVGQPTVQSDGSVLYNYEEESPDPQFYAVERLQGANVVERSVLYKKPQESMVFQATSGQPPIKLDNVTQSVTKLEGGTYKTTVTCVESGGRTKEYKFETDARSGAVTKSPSIEERPTTDFTAWKPEYVRVLSPDLAARLTDKQIREIPVPAMAALSEQQIQKLTPQAVAGMTPDQIKALSTTQFKALTNDQLTALTADQLKVLTEAQLKELTPAQASALLSNIRVSDLTAANKALLQTKKGS